MNHYDTIIVGGGPIGAYVAKTCAQYGHSTALYEQHYMIGQPVNCAGLVTPRVFKEFHIPTKPSIQNKIYGANIYPPSGKPLVIGGDSIHAYAINRRLFDQQLIQQAKSKGASIFLNHKLLSAQRTNNQLDLSLRQQKDIIHVTTNLLIGADGPQSFIRQQFFLSKPKERLHGIGLELVDTDMDPRFIHMFLGTKLAPGFFGWVIPTHPKGTTARIGLCIQEPQPHSPKFYFHKFQQHSPVRSLLDQATPTTMSGGLIPLGVLKMTATDNVMIVGDAAAQVKPTSGGGIFPGLRCAHHCAETAHKAINTHQFHQQILKQYHKQWQNDLGRELGIGMRFRALFTRLSDKELDKYIEKLNTPKLIDVINTYGDIDYPSKLIFPLMKKAPSLLKLALPRKP